MAKIQVGYDEGHLVVAAIRVLSHRHQGRPPTIEEIHELTGLSNEWAGVLVAGLVDIGILRAMRGPFETRVEVLDHLGLEKLPRQEAAAGVDEELREFSERKREEEEKLRNLFTSGDALKKQEKKASKLEEDLKNWKPKKPKGSSLFDDLTEK